MNFKNIIFLYWLEGSIWNSLKITTWQMSKSSSITLMLMCTFKSRNTTIVIIHNSCADKHSFSIIKFYIIISIFFSMFDKSEVEVLVPSTKNCVEDIISWAYPVLMLVIDWHWELEEENIYLHIDATFDASYPIIK